MSIFPSLSRSASCPFAHQHRWRGWRLLHSARRTRGLSSHPWWWTVPPHYHTSSRWACLPRSAQTRASACCASPHHWGLRPGPQSRSQGHLWDYSQRLKDPRAHNYMKGTLTGAVVTAGWVACPWSRILKDSPWWVICLWTPTNPACPRTHQIKSLPVLQ